jgi:DNA-binding transcriptional regulator YiaG
MRDMAKKGRDFKIRGEQVTKSKLTNEDVRAIRASGELGKAVAARYGVSQATISRVRLRQCWKHIT